MASRHPSSFRAAAAIAVEHPAQRFRSVFTLPGRCLELQLFAFASTHPSVNGHSVDGWTVYHTIRADLTT